MRTVCTVVYQFDELEEDAKETARNWFREGAFNYEQWDATYEDAERIGLQITEFDIDHGTIRGRLLLTGRESARLIIADHGPICSTYETAVDCLYRMTRAGPFIEDDYLYRILQDYLYILRDEYEYFYSDESVDENIRCNENEFLADGKRA